MTFDVDAFMAEELNRRTKEVPMPKELHKYFDKKDKKVWVVQNLTGTEIAQADEAASSYAMNEDVLMALIEGYSKKVQAAVKKLLGKSKEIPHATAKRVEHLIRGSVDPQCDLDLALFINKWNGVFFIELTNQILLLSGQGMSLGKLKPSGKAKKSK